jgi:hypothetical protein
MDNLKLDGTASTWSLNNFAVAVAAHRPALSWAAVAERLDCPGFGISSEAAFTRLVSCASISPNAILDDFAACRQYSVQMFVMVIKSSADTHLAADVSLACYR